MSEIQNFSPFDSQLEKELQELTAKLNQNQISWLGGYYTALAKVNGNIGAAAAVNSEPQVNSDKPTITLLFGTKTGNAQKIMGWAQNKFEQQGYQTEVSELAEVDKNKLKQSMIITKPLKK